MWNKMVVEEAGIGENEIERTIITIWNYILGGGRRWGGANERARGVQPNHITSIHRESWLLIALFVCSLS